VSTFKAKKSSDKYVSFEQSFPFSQFDAWDLFIIFMRARDRNIGGNQTDCTVESLIKAFAEDEVK
jgi:hypothetical protein